MTLATYVEMPTPRRAMETGSEELLPADLTVQFGAGDEAAAGSVPAGWSCTAGAARPSTAPTRPVLGWRSSPPAPAGRPSGATRWTGAPGGGLLLFRAARSIRPGTATWWL